jgi:magnesium transporter
VLFHSNKSSICLQASQVTYTARCVEICSVLDSIAHILLDSIVDGFFPFLDWLEKEVMAIENVVFSGTGSGHEIQPVNTGPTLHSRATQHKHLQEQKDSEKTDSSLWQLSEKNVARLNPTHPRLSVSWPWLIMQWRPARHQRLKSTASMKSRSNPTLYTLHRMARARRLVTS